MTHPTRYVRRPERLLTDSKVVELYAQLQDSETVGMRAGISGYAVLQIVRAAGQPVRPRGGPPGKRAPLKITELEALALYCRGMTAAQVAQAAGCSGTTIYRILRDAGIERRRASPPRKGPG